MSNATLTKIIRDVAPTFLKTLRSGLKYPISIGNVATKAKNSPPIIAKRFVIPKNILRFGYRSYYFTWGIIVTND